MNITGSNIADNLSNTGAGNITIDGAGGVDTIVTGSGDDTITGGGGADIITPGLGTDTVILTEASAASDTVIFEELLLLNTQPHWVKILKAFQWKY